MKKVVINGLGRIGRATLKVLLEKHDFELVAVNDLVSPKNLAYLLKYDTVYGRYHKKVENDGKHLIIDGKKYMVINEKDPANLPWKDLDIDIVFECTGIFTKKEDLQKHVKAGAKYVILSAPSKSEEISTVVHGVNRNHENNPEIISCASCTTNCITPVVEIINRRIGIEKANMTTVHAYTSTQGLVDMPNDKMRRGRAAAANFVPTSTGAALATTQALPELKDKFDGAAIRGPVPVGSIADINFITSRKTSVEEVKDIFKEEAESDRYQDILGVTEEQLVSSDIVMDPRASIVDLSMIQVTGGDLVKVMSWYDNEWGYVNQMVREAESILSQ
ncbi:glyceraldehyde 3-phosphate dehydrogenase [Catalinimonas alkaloidigena]|uniref:type I glyceraldehyde-3-phosphate dehydrogenase n=1 Tax=Catalinimonas alkaloidigena TaxID=1075417 RepID=UPI0024073A6D|nr:type I glyceraldehyde-3-phosphate dehydrogenase [Catalinimonas alkaloidigena]MDF9801356.1 glyceraldehyde 3-phosphate dehydrogenase [Catalinimonas alkaloidigena]